MTHQPDERSSYLRYLPPLYSEVDLPRPQFSLGAVLQIFEKILTGIDDGVEISHAPAPTPGAAVDAHVHPSISAEISTLHELFDPWKTPAQFLPWLASWVALEFPELQGEPLWDEYQRRKVTSQIAQIYRQRGLKAGLNQYLDLYAVGPTRPRVALDDGSRVLAVVPQGRRVVPVTGLVTEGPLLKGNAVALEGIVRPSCAAVGGPGLFVGDAGVPPGNPTPVKSRVWPMGRFGEYVTFGDPPQRLPLAPTSMNLTRVAALAVKPAQGGTPERLFVLDQSGALFAVPAPYLGTTATSVGRLNLPGASFGPVAMSLDTNGDLLVLDRGDADGSPAQPQVLTVQTDPFAVRRTALTKIIEPLSLLVEADGTLLIGDGGPQAPSGPAQFPGNLWRVRRAGVSWTETALLPAANPLVAPTGLARGGDGHLYVLDAGLKPFSPTGFADPFMLPVAEPAAVHLVDLAATPPTTVRISQLGQFVYPIGLVAMGGRLVVCDPGHPLAFSRSRIRPFEFDVVVHFSASRLPADQAERDRVTAQAVGNVKAIINEQRPAHTIGNLVTRV